MLCIQSLLKILTIWLLTKFCTLHFETSSSLIVTLIEFDVSRKSTFDVSDVFAVIAVKLGISNLEETEEWKISREKRKVPGLLPVKSYRNTQQFLAWKYFKFPFWLYGVFVWQMMVYLNIFKSNICHKFVHLIWIVLKRRKIIICLINSKITIHLLKNSQNICLY